MMIGTVSRTAHELVEPGEEAVQAGAAGVPWDILLPRDVYPSTCDVRLVCGPPGGGKSTMVAARRGPTDRVIDLDELMAQLSGRPLYAADRSVWLLPALRLRNEQLRELEHAPRDLVAWFIVSAPGWRRRAWWCRRLRATSIDMCAPPVDECVRRIRADPRRAAFVQQHVVAARAWWDRELADRQASTLTRWRDDGEG